MTRQCYTPTPSVHLLEYVFDVRSWLAPCIHPIHGHSQPHSFRFTLSNEQAVMHYRNWSHENWAEESVTILKVL